RRGCRPGERAHLIRAAGHAAMSQLAATNYSEAAAVLWEPSTQLFSPDRFLAMSGMQDPLPLFLHPVPREGAQAEDGTPLLGIDFAGAEGFLGYALTVNPAPASLYWLATRAYALVDHERETGRRLLHGDSFGTAEGERIEVQVVGRRTRALVVLERDGQPMPEPADV
ncbi:MAG: hypothetical protein AAFR47_15690, partial [Pseudomonadota bacterium]